MVSLTVVSRRIEDLDTFIERLEADRVVPRGAVAGRQRPRGRDHRVAPPGLLRAGGQPRRRRRLTPQRRRPPHGPPRTADDSDPRCVRAPGARRLPGVDLAARPAGGRQPDRAGAGDPADVARRSAAPRCGPAWPAPRPADAAAELKAVTRHPRRARRRRPASWRCSTATCCPADVSAARRLLQLRLAQLARDNRVAFARSAATPEAIRDSALARLRVSAELSGRYDDIRKFIYALETVHRFRGRRLGGAGRRRRAVVAARSDAERLDLLQGRCGCPLSSSAGPARRCWSLLGARRRLAVPGLARRPPIRWPRRRAAPAATRRRPPPADVRLEALGAPAAAPVEADPQPLRLRRARGRRGAGGPARAGRAGRPAGGSRRPARRRCRRSR